MHCNDILCNEQHFHLDAISILICSQLIHFSINQALPLTGFLLVSEDEEEQQDETITAAYVEAFKDKSTMFERCVNEIKKAEMLIEQMMKTPVMNEEENEELQLDEEIPETEEDKLNMILELFKDSSRLVLTRYVKIWPGILAIAHAKINQKYEKIFNKLKFAPQPGRIVKNFTRPGALSIEGEDSHIATSCKIFPLKNFSREFRNKLSNLILDKDDEEDANEDDADEEEEGLAPSQDRPLHKQSTNQNTLKICPCCRFKTRNQEEIIEHMKMHPSCPQCGISFENDDSLKNHHNNYHAKDQCEKCGEEVLVVKMKQHIKSHELYKGFKKGMMLGKIKSKADKTKSKDGKRGQTAEENWLEVVLLEQTS